MRTIMRWMMRESWHLVWDRLEMEIRSAIDSNHVNRNSSISFGADIREPEGDVGVVRLEDQGVEGLWLEVHDLVVDISCGRAGISPPRVPDALQTQTCLYWEARCCCTVVPRVHHVRQGIEDGIGGQELLCPEVCDVEGGLIALNGGEVTGVPVAVQVLAVADGFGHND